MDTDIVADLAVDLAEQGIVLVNAEGLGRAFHEVASHGGPLTPCGYVDAKGEYVKVAYDENPPEDEFACLCPSIAAAILAAIQEQETMSEPERFSSNRQAAPAEPWQEWDDEPDALAEPPVAAIGGDEYDLPDAPAEPTTAAGRSLLQQWIGHENEPEVRIVILAIEAEARQPSGQEDE